MKISQCFRQIGLFKADIITGEVTMTEDAQLPELQVIHEDNHLLAVFKPAGMLVQGDETGDESLLDRTREWIRIKYQKPGNVYCGMIHRLDRPASGVILFAKT